MSRYALLLWTIGTCSASASLSGCGIYLLGRGLMAGDSLFGVFGAVQFLAGLLLLTASFTKRRWQQFLALAVNGIVALSILVTSVSYGFGAILVGWSGSVLAAVIMSAWVTPYRNYG